jgi:glyoxylase-like metal-dependent hydrolase (beta-lactamase superfamily II)
VLVGVPTPDMAGHLPMIEIFGRGGALKSAGTATACPAATSRCSSTSTCRAASTSTRSSPRRIGIDDVEAAFDKMHARRGAALGRRPADQVLWEQTHAEPPGAALADGDRITVGDVDLEVLHTPGHAPGACCLYAPALGVLLSGDTLFQGGPGATGRSFSDFPTIIDSIRDRLLTLPPETVVLTGHGDTTTIGAEAPHLQDWLDRGH